MPPFIIIIILTSSSSHKLSYMSKRVFTWIVWVDTIKIW